MRGAMKEGAANRAERNQVHRELRMEIREMKDTREPSKQSALPELEQLRAFALKGGYSA